MKLRIHIMGILFILTQNVQAQNDIDSAGVQLVSARTPDGVSSEVTLLKTWHPPVLSMFMPDGIVISVTATARTVLG